MSESFLKIESVSKSFGNTKALDNVSLDINKSELFSLLGSSGCGKSTLLRIIAGFEKPDSGKIYLDGEDITTLPPYLRPLNIMFQNYALFPHLNVKKNIEFGLKEENLENNEIDHRVKDITALLELTGLEIWSFWFPVSCRRKDTIWSGFVCASPIICELRYR